MIKVFKLEINKQKQTNIEIAYIYETVAYQKTYL